MIRWAPLTLAVLVAIVTLAYLDPATRWPAAVSRVDASLQRVEEAVVQEAWPKASAAVQRLRDQWPAARTILLLNSDEGDIGRFSEVLSRLEVAVRERDGRAAKTEAAVLRSVWQSLISW